MSFIKQYKVIRPSLICNCCGRQITYELILSSSLWKEVTMKRGLPESKEDGHVYICPSCIIETLDRELEPKKDLVSETKIKCVKVMYPINYWYVLETRKLGDMMKFIKNHINYFLKKRKIVYKDVCKSWLELVEYFYTGTKEEDELLDFIRKKEKEVLKITS